MSLKKALSYIIQQKHNHNAALIEVLKNSVKEAKTQERIIFLLKCKKSNVIPKFIQNPIKHTRKISKNDGFQRKVDSRVLTTSVHTTYLLHSTYIHFAWLTANVSCTICWLRARPKAERVFAEYENFLKLSDRPTDRDAFQRLISFEPSYRLTNGLRHLKATFNKSFVLA